MADPTPAPRTPRRRIPFKALIAAFLVIQIGVPGFQFLHRWVVQGAQPSREYPLSYQMYSATTLPHFVGTTADGTEVDISSTVLPRFDRVRSFGSTVQREICELYPEFVTVTRTHPNKSTGRVEC